MNAKIFLLATAVSFAATTPALAQTGCPNPYDGNGDGAVTIADLLDLLGLYGDTDSDLDGVWDSVDACVDVSACNYAADPTEPCAYIDVLGICGGGCEGDGDGDGICDDVDTCVGDLDECGVCNGPGPTEIVIEDITILYDSVYDEQIDTWFVFEVGADTTFTYTCAPFFGDCGDLVSYQGYDYATVLIGEQCWFAENLRNESYENGDAIPADLSNSAWSSTTSGATEVYGKSASNLETYGRFYNWYAVDDSRGLCPSGWHVPSDGEWTELTDYLGGVSIAGSQMKSRTSDTPPWNGTNSSGFSGLPGGFRDSSGGFYDAGFNGYWWSSSPSGPFAWYRYLYNFNADVFRGSNDLRNGFSVRCVRDAE
jgi:uncharacterized protein (TIGR02145 family)